MAKPSPRRTAGNPEDPRLTIMHVEFGATDADLKWPSAEGALIEDLEIVDKATGKVFIAGKSESGRRVADASQPTRVNLKISNVKLRAKLTTATEALGSKAKLAEYLGVARSQPGKWLSGEERPNPRARRLIQDLDYVWDRLTDDRPVASAALWLNSPNGFLGSLTPLDWIRLRGPEEVVGAIDAEAAGSYA